MVHHYKLKLQRFVCSNHYNSLYQTDDSDESDVPSDTDSLPTGSISSIDNGEKKKEQHIKERTTHHGNKKHVNDVIHNKDQASYKTPNNQIHQQIKFINKAM